MILWMDSFDAISTMAQKYDFNFNTSITTDGPFGDSALALTNTDHNAQKNLPTSYGPTFIMGCRMKFNSYSGDAPLFSLFDGASSQVDIRPVIVGSTIKLYVTRNGTTLGTGSIVMTTAIWYYVEFKVTIHDSTGIAVTRIDGVTDLNLSGLDTKNTSNATANMFRLGHNAGGTRDVRITDFILMDGVDSGVTGFPNNDFIGDIRVQALYPNADGTTSQMVGSDGNSTSNYRLVDEATPNDDTDYVETLTVGNKDTYNYGSLSAGTGLVYGIQINARARKTDAGTRKFKLLSRFSGTEIETGPEKILSLSYQNFYDIREADPSGNPWDISSVNAMEAGAKLTT